MSSVNYKIVQKCLVVFAFLVFVISLIIAYLNQANTTLFLSTNGIVDAKYYQEISPAGTAFGIVWPIIYLWNAVAIFYILLSIFLPENKSPVNVEPTLVPITFLISYSFAFAGTLGWLFAFDREILGLALFLLIFCMVSLYITLGISYKRVHDNVKQLDTKEKRVMLWLVRILIQNGLALPATWLTIATCLNLTDVIIYEDSLGVPFARERGTISIKDASSAILAVLFFLIIVWFVLDNFVLNDYTRYTFTVYPVLILGLSGLVGKLRFRRTSDQNLIFSSVILGFCIVFLIIRVLLFLYRYNLRKSVVENQNSKISLEKA